MYRFKVEGMTCGSCAEGIEDALKRLDPNVEVHVDMSSETVEVKTSRDQREIIPRIEDEGYNVLAAEQVG